MALHSSIMEQESWRSISPVGMKSLTGDLRLAGKAQLGAVARAIEEAAPRPGLLVYVTTKKLAMPMNGLDAVIFSAIDANTHLQVAQLYHALTIGSAISFVEFAAESFPFPISQIRTTAERPFHNGGQQSTPRDFSVMIGRRGYIHSPAADCSRDALFSIASKLLYSVVSGECAMHASSNDLQRELAQFIFFHNNYRSLPWFKGKTPLQKLKAIEGFSHVHVFSVFDTLEGGESIPGKMRRFGFGSSR